MDFINKETSKYRASFVTYQEYINKNPATSFEEFLKNESTVKAMTSKDTEEQEFKDV